LRNKSKEITDADAPLDWHRVLISYQDRERLIEEVLWYGEDVVVIKPEVLRQSVITRLQSGVKRYG
jgi:predicted DNA-binding transcriptional regulator YafY